MKLLGCGLNIKKIVNKYFPTITSATYIGETLKITYSNNAVKEYYGGCTVWYLLPMMKRCSTVKEGELLRIWKYIQKYGNFYPTAQ